MDERGEVVDVADRELADAEHLPVQRVVMEEELTVPHLFGPAEEGMRIAKHVGRFEQPAQLRDPQGHLLSCAQVISAHDWKY